MHREDLCRICQMYRIGCQVKCRKVAVSCLNDYEGVYIDTTDNSWS